MDEVCGRQWLKEDLHTGRADIFISLGLRETETHSLPNLKAYFTAPLWSCIFMEIHSAFQNWTPNCIYSVAIMMLFCSILQWSSLVWIQFSINPQVSQLGVALLGLMLNWIHTIEDHCKMLKNSISRRKKMYFLAAEKHSWDFCFKAAVAFAPSSEVVT